MRVDELYIANPNFPYTYFPFDSDKSTVTFALLYDEIYDKDGNFTRSLSESETNVMCAQVKEELSLNMLDWGCSCGRTYLNIDKDDLGKTYSIVKAFLERKHRIYLQDGTQVTFSSKHLVPEDRVGYIGQQEVLLQILEESLRLSLKPLINLPFHRDAFWTIEAGKKFASKYRELYQMDDRRNDKEMWIGEAFTERDDIAKVASKQGV